MEEPSLAGLFKTRLWNTRHSAVGNNAALSERWTQLLNRSLLSVSCDFPFKNIYSAGLFLMGRQSVLRAARRLEGRGGRNGSQADARFAFCRACSSGHGESWSDVADVVFWSCNQLIPRSHRSRFLFFAHKRFATLLSSARLWCPGLLVVGLWSHRQRCRCCTGRWLLLCQNIQRWMATYPALTGPYSSSRCMGSLSSRMERLWWRLIKMTAKLEEKLVARNPSLSDHSVLR